MLHKYLLAIESPLTEAQNYIGMFNDFIGTDASAQPTIQKYIDWARSNLKKNDRIVWFLRWVRVELAGRMKHLDSDQELARLNKRLKSQYSRYDMVPISNLMTNLQHYVSMPIQGIQDTVWGKQSPQELLSEFKQMEDDWKETSNERNLLSYPEGDEPTKIMQFPDGFAWFDLETSSCREEGRAMGHCGNTAANGYGDTVLSLRKPARAMDGRTYWYPVLTFILDSNGDLGEMKGRGNDKPAERYHPYIIALLKSDRVRGIKGGGYMPSHNFKLSDLDRDVQEELLAEKPELGDVEDLYKKEGMSQRVLDRIETAMDSHGLSTGRYEPDEKRFVVEEWKDYDRFLSSLYVNDVEKILEIAKGEADFQHSDDEQSFVETLRELPEVWQAKIAHHAGVAGKLDDQMMNEVATRLMSRDDEYYRLFQEITQGSESIREQAWERLFQYEQSGWSFASYRAYLNIPSESLAEFRAFVESDQPVQMYVSEQDMLGYASAETGGDYDDEYGYEIMDMGRDSGRPSWDAINNDNQTEHWSEEDLTDRRGNDKWLAGVDAGDGSPLTQEYLNALQGRRMTMRIDDPRQEHLKFESMRRHINTVALLLG
jgi:hypothetical protein